MRECIDSRVWAGRYIYFLYKFSAARQQKTKFSDGEKREILK